MPRNNITNNPGHKVHDHRYYDFIADGYDELHRCEQEKKLFLIIDWLKKRSFSGPLLDVGAGTGFSLDILSSFLGCEVVGLEPSDGMIKQYSGSKRLVKGFAEDIPFPENEFEGVVSVTAIQNFFDIPRAVSEMVRVCSRNGFIVVSCLKKSPRLKEVSETLAEQVSVLEIVEEDKDLIFFCVNDKKV